MTLRSAILNSNAAHHIAVLAPFTLPTQYDHLVRCSSCAAVLGQFQHGPIALATGRAIEAVGSIIMDPLVIAEVPG